MHRSRFQSFLFLAVTLSCVSPGHAQPGPRFPLPNRSDVRVEQKVKQSLGGMGEVEQRVKAITQIYPQLGKGEKFPPHPLSCDAGGAKSRELTIPAWQFDSESAMFGGKNISGSALPTDTFMGCFQPMQRPDLPVPPFCVPVGLGFEICWDPPPLTGNCCAQNSDLLEQGGLPRRFRLLAFFFPPLAPFVGDGCNVPREKSNRGYKLTYWWPENEAEIHNYERTVWDPTFECNNEMLQHGNLTDFLRQHDASLTAFSPPGVAAGPVYKSGRAAGIPDDLRYDPHIGESHWAGIQPGDETFTGEAHVYRTYLNTLTALNYPGNSTQLGYKRDCRCFYTGLDDNKVAGRKRKVVNGWTEFNKYLPYWRYYQNSILLNEKKYEAIMKYQDYNPDSCAFLRAWDKGLGAVDYGYQDLYKAIGIWPPPQNPPRLREELLRICYKGGGDLFPITGQLIGQFNPLPAGAYLARRAFFLFGRDTIGRNGQVIDREFVPPERRINKYSDAEDKMQRIYPLKDRVFASRCYQGHEIPNYLQASAQDWPSDIMEDPLTSSGEAGPNDSPRYLYWNKRRQCMCPYVDKAMGLRYKGKFIACTLTSPACEGESNGDFEDSDTAPLQGFGPGHVPIPIFPDGVPYPFLPKYGAGRYTTDPLRISDPAVIQIVGGERSPRLTGGQCELSLNRTPLKLHRRLPEQFEDEYGANDGGVRCRREYPRCTPGKMPPR